MQNTLFTLLTFVCVLFSASAIKAQDKKMMYFVHENEDGDFYALEMTDHLDGKTIDFTWDGDELESSLLERKMDPPKEIDGKQFIKGSFIFEVKDNDDVVKIQIYFEGFPNPAANQIKSYAEIQDIEGQKFVYQQASVGINDKGTKIFIYPYEKDKNKLEFYEAGIFGYTVIDWKNESYQVKKKDVVGDNGFIIYHYEKSFKTKSSVPKEKSLQYVDKDAEVKIKAYKFSKGNDTKTDNFVEIKRDGKTYKYVFDEFAFDM
ncbi:MAG: hypothetical protein JJT94_16960 [Bernardetiaceae bacterium]|nr:hypothetical protein [Bernardetiaceae bacterium]